jgi:catechol 2,3-dioxygenase-like lactoylglutathione lyase family enzyme
MKTHISLATSDLERSVAFYSVLLNARPMKSLGDYALFVTEEPGLELALNPRRSVSTAQDSHFGVLVESVVDVERAIERLQGAGFEVDVERDETCCYAKQTKVWATDPDGRRWETYHVLEDTQERDGADLQCCAGRTDDALDCCAG